VTEVLAARDGGSVVSTHALAAEVASPDAPAADERQAFVELYLRRYDAIVRLAFLLTGSNETAQDLVHDAFVRVHRAGARVEHPDAYLRTAVVNACNSHHRRAAVSRRFRAEPAPPVELEADELSDALARLTPRQRAAIVLRYWNDCTEADIAATLGCRTSTVAGLLQRGLASLREVIEP
jgi:RNA polymerase sigma factor (sigma-70 family)